MENLPSQVHQLLSLIPEPGKIDLEKLGLNERVSKKTAIRDFKELIKIQVLLSKNNPVSLTVKLFFLQKEGLSTTLSSIVSIPKTQTKFISGFNLGI